MVLGVLGLSDNWIKTDSLAPLPAQATLLTPQLLPGSHPQHPGSKGLHRRGCGGAGGGGRGEQAWSSCRTQPVQALLPTLSDTWGR